MTKSMRCDQVYSSETDSDKTDPDLLLFFHLKLPKRILLAFLSLAVAPLLSDIKEGLLPRLLADENSRTAFNPLPRRVDPAACSEVGLIEGGVGVYEAEDPDPEGVTVLAVDLIVDTESLREFIDGGSRSEF